MDDPTEVEAKMAYDHAFAGLSAQRTDLQQMQGRAKDLVGLLTLSASFLAAFGKTPVEGVLHDLSAGSVVLLALFIAFPAITFIAALFVLTPRSFWVFDLNAEAIADATKERKPNQGFDTTTALYLWYVYELAPFLKGNGAPLRRRKWALWGATTSLAASAVMIVFLVVSKL